MKPIYHDGLNITEKAIDDEYDLEKLIHYSEVIKTDLVKLNSQLEKEKAFYKKHGVNSNSDWYHKLKTKRRLYGQLDQKVERQIVLSKQAFLKPRKEKEKIKYEIFAKVCRKYVSPDFYKKLWDETDKEVSEILKNKKPD